MESIIIFVENQRKVSLFKEKKVQKKNKSLDNEKNYKNLKLKKNKSGNLKLYKKKRI